MAVELNHTIVAARDKVASAEFLTGILGLPAPTTFGPFSVVRVSNAVSLDYLQTEDEIPPQHLAFKVGDEEFGPIFDRIRASGVQYWADPHHQRPGEINTADGGQGVYFTDADGHNLEVLTRDYGSGS
ncbi:VOC family protein [Kutzneria viridogrisea]|uniref:VOC domain-containing protein n=2 Tax=Kutzneria TaxID=43356 RepID=W5WDJ4_9PSEU|nr:VOC family protein [Kutzneria albida]AHH96264.1 hypothetical protein KALB_2896 [Kutzneria albida DSM 43870]MBA8928523.1 catechol 2,3-dioxygenase-like lactoylglutathione lyase family enzyme [Kutzneria viridogrisea]